MMEEQIKNIFEKQGGVMRTKELSEHGIYYRKLRTLIEEGKVEKIRYGYYQWQDDKAFSEASLVAALFPEGILCMETALLYYDYTDRTRMRGILQWIIVPGGHNFTLSILR